MPTLYIHIILETNFFKGPKHENFASEFLTPLKTYLGGQLTNWKEKSTLKP
jgi:hypothetical protein